MFQNEGKITILNETNFNKIIFDKDELIYYYYDKKENSEITIFLKNLKNKIFINKKIKKKCSKKIFIILDVIENYNYIKSIIKSIDFIFNNMKLEVRCLIFKNNSKYYLDIINCLKAINITDKYLKYEFIYDRVCDKLDSDFKNCNCCDFKENRCVNNRLDNASYKSMGCCYSFDFRKIFDVRYINNVQVCEYLGENGCTQKNISCKLFTCRYLRKKGIKYDTHKILLLECFLNKKKHDVIKFNYFRTKEQILKKLLEEHKGTYYFYIFHRKYLIEKDYK